MGHNALETIAWLSYDCVVLQSRRQARTVAHLKWVTPVSMIMREDFFLHAVIFTQVTQDRRGARFGYAKVVHPSGRFMRILSAGK